MLLKIKNRIEQELERYARNLNKAHSLNKVSSPLWQCIKDFILRKGKRIRPVLFILGYLGFAKKKAPHLYKSALSIELLHDFMLVHDDIIDKSETRRGKASMHQLLNEDLAHYQGIKFNGEDLALVVGDVLFALGIDMFLAIEENPKRKEKALRQLIRAALYTGSGEFIELLSGTKNLKDISKGEIYKIYDYKTAYYTFSSPLAIGAILAGAGAGQIKRLIEYGLCLGRAFQIKDDILGMFSEEGAIGKSTLTDLQEAKKTLLIWYAYRHCNQQAKIRMQRILNKQTVNRDDLWKMRRIISGSGAVDYAKREVNACLKQAEDTLAGLKMQGRYKLLLNDYSAKILKLS